MARKLKKLPSWLIKGIKEAALAIKHHKSIAPLVALFDDIAILAKTKGGLELLSKTTDSASLKKMATFAEAYKDKSLMLYRLAGDKIIDIADKIKDTQAIKAASTFGEKGIAVLEKLGAKKFMTFAAQNARPGKVFYKHAKDIFLKALATLPLWLLFCIVGYGILIWLPLASWVKAGGKKAKQSLLRPAKQQASVD